MKTEDKNELQPISDVLREWRFRNNRDKLVKEQEKIIEVDTKIIASYRKSFKILIGLFILSLGVDIVQMIIK